MAKPGTDEAGPGADFATIIDSPILSVAWFWLLKPTGSLYNAASAKASAASFRSSAEYCHAPKDNVE